ncbi:MAG TPA: penicillin-binding transpeptidase domain-containing protein [Solirubrobacteraceae bacterium]|jgi:cell division protein FtsI/penicillin-binding protein 2|nr:penicillin-binding transpeptidase domain-containing protein [Solirubrobacteraceae bacterium]
MRRALPVLALAGVSFVIGLIVGANSHTPASHTLASSYVTAWARGDYRAMYSDIDAASRRGMTPAAFASAYRQALLTATASGVRPAGKPHDEPGGIVAVPVRVHTSLFGTLALSFMLKIGDSGEGERVSWSRSMLFPGLLAEERLRRTTTLPPRAALLARDGTVLAEGSTSGISGEQTRSSPLGELASPVIGSVGPVPAARRQALQAQGVEADAIVGVSGLERAFDDRLRGTPGGELLAESEHEAGKSRVLASALPRAARALRTSVSPTAQRAAVAALGGQLGGIVAMRPSGQILAVAGIGLDGLQPPGSTFKMITLSGALQAGIATPRSVFPYASYATLDGVRLNNANGENCGGTLELAFAVSCNSVFSPLGVKLGAARLVSMAERFGFNRETGVAGAPESTLPPASGIQGELAVGSTAIGQGQVLATPLQMAAVAATIADEGRRPKPTFDQAAASAPAASVLSVGVARTVRRLMIGVVREGTGTSAAIPGVVVAGKTGTAELKSQCSSAGAESASSEESGSGGREGCSGTTGEASNTDAWFAAFAPALHPRVVVAVLLVKDGAGGTTAAPVARQVIEAGLQAGAH